MSAYHSPYQYRRLAFDDAALLPRPWPSPPSPTLMKNQSNPRCPVFLIALPLFLLMTAAPLLSAIFRPQPPSPSTLLMRTTAQNIATNKHVVHPLSVPSDSSPQALHHSPSPLPTPAFSCSPAVTVHVIFSNHLDVGFRAYNPEGWFAANVIDQALNQWIPDAITAAADLANFTQQANPHNDTYTWTTHPWLLSLALDCPPHMGFRCPDKSAIAAMERAVADGVISFHAFPFNVEAELYNRELFDFGIQLTHDLAARLHKPDGPPRVISQRDVPGVTRAVIPVMFNRSVRAFSIGSNPAAQPPDVPSAFLWKFDESVESPSIIVLYHRGDYGGIDRSDAVIIDGFNHVALFDWNADNAGPYTAQQVVKDLQHVREQFHNCSVKTSTFDEYVSALYSAVQEQRVQLPVITAEMGDTWIHGSAADPIKMAKVRAVQRLRSQCIAASSCDSSSYAFYNFSRLLLKAGEHTFGADVSELLGAPDQFDSNSSYYLWSNDGLRRGLERPEYQTLIETWREQRAWAIDIPLSALPESHWVRVTAQDEFAAIRARPVELSEWEAVGSSGGANISGNGWEIGVGSDGSIDWLRSVHNDRVYAAPGVNALGRLVYQAWTEGDQNDFVRDYCYISPDKNSWVRVDYGKLGLDRVVQPNLTRHEPAIIIQAYTRTTAQPELLSLYVHTRLPAYTTVTYGGWQSAWSLITLNTTSVTISITLTIYNKTATRIPESPAFIFSYPTAQYPTLSKLSTPINTSHIITHGSHHLHAVDEAGLRVDGWATVQSADVALVGLGGSVSAFPVPFVLESVPTQFYFVLFDNVWGTNYVEWWPFEDDDKDAQYRFEVILQTREEAGQAETAVD